MEGCAGAIADFFKGKEIKVKVEIEEDAFVKFVHAYMNYCLNYGYDGARFASDFILGCAKDVPTSDLDQIVRNIGAAIRFRKQQTDIEIWRELQEQLNSIIYWRGEDQQP